jgi:hypothetical protein
MTCHFSIFTYQSQFIHHTTKGGFTMFTLKLLQYVFSILGVLSLGFIYYQLFNGESRKSGK